MKIKRKEQTITSIYRLSATVLMLLMFSAFSTKGVRPNADQSAYRSPDATLDQTLSPYLMVDSDSPDMDRIPLKHNEATVNVTGVIANVKVEQVYVNEGSRPIEAIYVFPGSTRAAVHGMTMQIGERRIEARISEKEKARQAYEQAKQDGRTASLLEQHRPNVFQMSVANIMPGDSLIVELRYTELLVPENGTYSFIYPTVVGPRYHGDPGMEVASIDENWVSNPYQPEGDAPLYTFHVSGTINAGTPIRKAACGTHKLNFRFHGPEKVSFASADSEVSGGNRDLILKYRLRGDKVESGVMLFEGKDENYFLAMMEPPERVRPDEIPPREYMFVVDVSGSMNGFPLEVSKKLMQELLSGLRPSDSFNVLLFASANSVLSKHSLPATTENINKAMRLIDNQQGGGGTQLLPALKRALNMPHESGISRTVVIATDGYISADKQAMDLVTDNLGEANFFAFGIGSSVNRFLIEGLAHAGKGEPFVMTNSKEAKAGAKRFKAYIESPVLTDIQLEFAGLKAYDVEPMQVPDVFSERPVIVYGKYKGDAHGKLIITGQTGNGRYRNESIISPALASADNEALKYLWARKRIRTLDDYGKFGQTDELKTQVTDLGLKYGLLTQFTSFVAIDTEVRNKNGTSETVVQPLPLPLGVSDMAVSGGSTGYSMPSPSGYGNAVGSRKAVGRPDYSIELKEEVVFDRADDKLTRNNRTASIRAEKMPEFVGGEKALKNYLKIHLALTDLEKAALKGSKVMIRLTVNQQGGIEDMSITGIKDKALKNRIVNVLMKMPVWIPGTDGGEATDVRISIQLPLD